MPRNYMHHEYNGKLISTYIIKLKKFEFLPRDTYLIKCCCTYKIVIYLYNFYLKHSSVLVHVCRINMARITHIYRKRPRPPCDPMNAGTVDIDYAEHAHTSTRFADQWVLFMFGELRIVNEAFFLGHYFNVIS